MSRENLQNKELNASSETAPGAITHARALRQNFHSHVVPKPFFAAAFELAVGPLPLPIDVMAERKGFEPLIRL
jgi:hypothetical protein